MFELLTRILLWLLVATIVWYVFIRFIPRAYLTWLGGLIVFTFVLLAFISPARSSTVAAVWSILSFPLKPLGLAIALLLASIRGGVKKMESNLVVAALIILVLSSMPIVAYWLASQSDVGLSSPSVSQTSASQRGNVRAIVVLGDSVGPTDPSFRTRVQVGNMEEGFSNSLASRLMYTGEIYQNLAAQGNQPLVVVGAGPQFQGRSPQEKADAEQLLRQMLVGAGVPGDRIWIETEGADLRESIVNIGNGLVERGFQPSTYEAPSVDEIILVAPALTIGRTRSTFAQQGIRSRTSPTDQFGFQLNRDRLVAAVPDLIPNVDALALTTRVVDEYLASVYYFLRGWMVSPFPY